VADGWCWFILREEYCWLVAGGWFVLREKYCWLVADKPSEQGDELQRTGGVFFFPCPECMHSDYIAQKSREGRPFFIF
jgi:hypothetical protein